MFYFTKPCQQLTRSCLTSQTPFQLLAHHPVVRTSTKAATISKTFKEEGELPLREVTNIVHTNIKPTVTIPNKPVESEWTPIKLDLRHLPDHYLKLSKSRLTSLVVLTSMAGYAMAPASFELTTFALCSAGTGLLSCAANAINQYHEVPFDAQMARTRNRILVRYTLSPVHALGFASVCATSGLSILYCGINPLTASLGLANLVLYTSIYTPLKRISILNTWVGSIVGALPPLMGWAACTGGLEPGAWVLAGVLYAWQFPHFNALSWNLRPDYSRAGYRMMSVTNPGLCRWTALRYTALLVPLSLAAPYLELTNSWFAYESLPLNCYFLFLAWKFYKKSDSSTSRKLFHFSLIQLPLLMVLMLINKKYWHNQTNEETKPQSTVSTDTLSIPIPLVVKPSL